MFYFVGFGKYTVGIHQNKNKKNWVCGEGTLEVQALFKRLGVQRDEKKERKKDPKTKRKIIVEVGVF